jgi:hypothetical protein
VVVELHHPSGPDLLPPSSPVNGLCGVVGSWGAGLSSKTKPDVRFCCPVTRGPVTLLLDPPGVGGEWTALEADPEAAGTTVVTDRLSVVSCDKDRPFDPFTDDPGDRTAVVAEVLRCLLAGGSGIPLAFGLALPALVLGGEIVLFCAAATAKGEEVGGGEAHDPAVDGRAEPSMEELEGRGERTCTKMPLG